MIADAIIFLLIVSPEQNPNLFPTKSRCGMNRSATALASLGNTKEKCSLLS